MEHLRSLWHSNWAHIWGGIKLAVGSAGASVSVLGHVLNDGSVKSAIDSLHLNPNVMLGLAILGVVTILSAPHE